MSVLYNSTMISQASLLSAGTTNVYDHQGAALYIAVILIWYSTGLAMMLFLQVRPRSLQHQFHFDRSINSKKQRLQSLAGNPFSKYRNVHADNNTKQILNELKDPERRQRLWKIYYASAEKQNEPDPQYYQTMTGDTAAIDRINRKLADIHRIDAIQNDENHLVPAPISSTNDNRVALSFESSKFFTKRFPALRRPAGVNGQGTNRTTNIRGASLADGSPPNETVEMESLINNNVSRKRNLFATRFVIEKVSNPSNHLDQTNEEEGVE